MIACSSTGQFCHDGSCGWQRARGPPGPASSATSTGPRQPSTSPTPNAGAAGAGDFRVTRPVGQPACDARDQAAGFLRLVEAHRDPRRDVALGAHARSPAPARRRARTASRRAASKAWPLARPASPTSPSRAASSGVTVPARREAIAHAVVFVVDLRAALRTSRASRTRVRSQRLRRVRRDVDARAAGHDAVHQVALSEGALDGAQPVFLEPRELREAEGEARVVAERARGRRDGWRCARPRAQRRATRRRVAGSRSRPDPRAPGNRPTRTRPPNRPRPAPRGDGLSTQAELGEAPLDALVRVAEPLLEPEHLFADDRKAEMSRLDDAGVHRSDRDLVHAVTLHAHERVVVDRRTRLSTAASPRSRTRAVETGPRARRHVAATDAGPSSVDAHAAQIERGALHARRAGKDRLEPGIARLRRSSRVRHRRTHRSRRAARVPARRKRSRPQRGRWPAPYRARPATAHSASSRPPAAASSGGALQPVPGRHAQPPHRSAPGSGPREPSTAHRTSQGPPISRAAARYQSARYGGT